MKYLLFISTLSFFYYTQSQCQNYPPYDTGTEENYEPDYEENYAPICGIYGIPCPEEESAPEEEEEREYEIEAESAEEAVTEIYMPPVEFLLGEESIIEAMQVDGQTYWERMLLNDVNIDLLTTDLNNANSAALKDAALSTFIKDKLGGSPNSSDNQVINLGTSNQPLEPQAQNINVANIERIVTASNWTGVDTSSSNTQNVNIPASLNADSLDFILNTGSVLAASLGIEASLLTSFPYQIAAVDSISNQGPTTYTVSLQLLNSQGLDVNASFTMSYLPSGNAWKVSSFSYQFLQSSSGNLVVVDWANNTGDYTVTTNTDSIVMDESQYLSLGGYTLIPNITNYPQYNKLKYLMIAGLNWVARQGIQNGALANDIYDIVQTHSVYVRQDASGADVLFRYDVNAIAKNTTGKGARMNYEVFYALETQVQAYGFYYSI